MQRILSLFMLSALLFATPFAFATKNTTVSLGYAQTHMGALKNSASNDLRGLSVRLRYESSAVSNANWGLLASYTVTTRDITNYRWEDGKLHKENNDTVRYGSFMMGPTYRVNNFLSLYGNIGGAAIKIKHKERASESETSFAYGAGFIMEPFTNLSLDFSWEASKFDFANTNTFGMGIGYRF